VYLVQFNALLRHPGPVVLKTEDPELSLHQVGGVLFHGGHIKRQPPEVRVEVCGRDYIYKKGERERLIKDKCVNVSERTDKMTRYLSRETLLYLW